MTNRLYDCAELTANLLGTSIALIDKKTRKSDVMEKRQLITYVCYHFCNIKGNYFNSLTTVSSSLSKIADLFGNNHDNVLATINTINNLSDTEPQLKQKLENIIDFVSKNLYFYKETSSIIYSNPEFTLCKFLREDDNYLSIHLKRNNNQFVIKESELKKINETLWMKS